MIILITKMKEMITCCEDCQLSYYGGGILNCGQVSADYDNHINMIGRKRWTRHEDCPLIESNDKIIKNEKETI